MIRDNLYLIGGLVLCGLFAYASSIGWDIVNFNPVSKNGGPSAGGVYSGIYHK